MSDLNLLVAQGNDSVATLQNQYRNVLLQQEERHAEEKRSLIESHLLKLSALEAQMAETRIRNEDLVQLQTVSHLSSHSKLDSSFLLVIFQSAIIVCVLCLLQVMEAEHEMEVKELRQQLKRVHSKDSKQEEYVSNLVNQFVLTLSYDEDFFSFFFSCYFLKSH